MASIVRISSITHKVIVIMQESPSAMNSDGPGHSATLCRLEHLAAISITGADAAAFLQGQLTCDTRAITLDHSSPGALCTPAGRVVATIQLLRSMDEILLLLNRDLSAPVMHRLAKYVLRAKVSLADAGDAWRIAGWMGSEPDRVLQQFGLALPTEVHAAAANELACVVRMPGEPLRCLLLLRQEARVTGLATQDSMVWRMADIACGLPHVGAQFSEAFTPQMLNLDLTGAVSFAKGCYTGQEVVARTHYLGQPKRRTYRYSACGTPQPGDALYVAEQDEMVGTVVNAVGDQLLAVVQCEDHAKPLCAGGPDGQRLQLESLPYGEAAWVLKRWISASTARRRTGCRSIPLA